MALVVAVVGLSQNSVDAFGGQSSKPGYHYVLQCSGVPRRCTRVEVPKPPEKPRKFCYTKGEDGEGSYKLTTCDVATKNCKRTYRTMYHEKYHGKRDDDSVYLCEYVKPRVSQFDEVGESSRWISGGSKPSYSYGGNTYKKINNLQIKYGWIANPSRSAVQNALREPGILTNYERTNLRREFGMEENMYDCIDDDWYMHGYCNNGQWRRPTKRL